MAEPSKPHHRALQAYERAWLLFLLRHLCVGIATAFVVGGGLLYYDIGQLATLAGSSDRGLVAVVLLFCGLIITFGSVAMGAAIMSLGRDDK